MTTELGSILAEVQSDSLPLSKEEFAAMKKAERDAVYGLSDQTALEVAGDEGKFQQYLDLQIQLRHASPELKNELYSESNALLVLAQKPNATRIADFDYWKDHGCFVKKNEKGISIIERGDDYIREDGSPGRSYDIKKVFDISQVDDSKLRQEPEPQYTERLLLKSLVAHAPVRIDLVEHVPDGYGAEYHAETDSISVQQGMKFHQTFRSLAEATATYYLTTGPDTQAQSQFSAHCAAYMLCKKYGVETSGFWFSDAPIVLKGMDAKEIKGELSQISDVAADISMHMEKTLEPPKRGERVLDAGAR